MSSKRGSQIPLHQISRRAFKIHIPRHALSTLQSWRWNSAFYLFFILILIANFPPDSFLFIYFWLHWVIIALPGLLWKRFVGFSLRRLLLWSTGSGAWIQQLWYTGLVAPQHVGSFRTRNQTCVLEHQRSLEICILNNPPLPQTF